MGNVAETMRNCPGGPIQHFCPKRNALLDAYVAAACAHARALEELRAILLAGLDEQFAAMLEIAAQACGNCEQACKAFDTHRSLHGC